MGQRVVEVIYKLKALIRVEAKSWKVECLLCLPDRLSHWTLLCKIVRPLFSLIIHPLNILFHLTGGIYISVARLINNCTYSPLFS